MEMAYPLALILPARSLESREFFEKYELKNEKLCQIINSTTNCTEYRDRSKTKCWKQLQEAVNITSAENNGACSDGCVHYSSINYDG